MLDEKDLQAIKALFNEEMDKKLNPIHQDIKEMKTDIQGLKESVEEIRGATNYMVKWIEKVEKKVDEIA